MINRLLRAPAICTILAVCIQILYVPVGFADDNTKTANAYAEIGPGSPANANLELVSTFEGGSLYKAGKFDVVVLNGTYLEMGRQYGGLLGPQIKGMYEELSNDGPNILAAMENLSTKKSSDNMTLEDFTNYSLQLYPKRFQEMIRGMSETSDVSEEDIGKINEFLRYYVFWKWLEEPDAGAGHCSAMVAWGNYTGGNPLVMGRNFDATRFFEKFDKYLTVVVFNPSDGSNSAAIFTYAGMIGSPQTFNDAGLVLEGDDASTAGDSNRPINRIPLQIREIQLALDCSNLAGLDAGIMSSRISHALINVVANESGAYCYESTTFDVKRRCGIDGLLIAANHFLIPDWSSEGIFTNETSSSHTMMDSVSRHQNLTVLGNKYKGKINATVMMAIFDTLTKDGGATLPRDTTYQFVAVPEERIIWIKAPGFEDWRGVNLGALFE
jgi:hypothetical protein